MSKLTEPSLGAGRSGRLRSATVVAAALAVLLSGCADPELEDAGDAQPLNEPPVEPPAISPNTVPLPLGGEPLWAAPFSSDPKPAGDGFVGLAMPDDENTDLRFLGVDADGTTRWSTPRNPSCTAFGVSRAGGGDLVVLLDSDAAPEEGLAATRTTASGYDPNDGTQTWGPVDVPGTLVGPGLVFAENAGSIMSDTSGARVALAPDDGDVVADEREADIGILHEHEGALLTQDDDVYSAWDTVTDEELWSSSDLTPPESLSAEADTARLVYGPRPKSDSSPVVVFGWSTSTKDEEDVYTVHDLRTGEPLAELDGGRDPEVYAAADGVTSVVSGMSNGVETAFAFSGTERLWQIPDIGDVRLERVAGDAVYFAAEGTTRVFDLASGAELGTGVWDAPLAASADGTTLLRVDSSGDGDLFVALQAEDLAEGGV